MNTSDLKMIIDRIFTATPESPIYVWEDEGNTLEGKLFVAFGSTVVSQRKKHQPNFVGAFHCQDDLFKVRDLLRQKLS